MITTSMSRMNSACGRGNVGTYIIQAKIIRPTFHRSRSLSQPTTSRTHNTAHTATTVLPLHVMNNLMTTILTMITILRSILHYFVLPVHVPTPPTSSLPPTTHLPPPLVSPRSPSHRDTSPGEHMTLTTTLNKTATTTQTITHKNRNMNKTNTNNTTNTT